MFLKLLLTAAAVSTLALAQGSMAGGGGGGRGEQGAGAVPMGNTRAPKETKAEQIVSKLKLSKDQTTEFESTMEVAYQAAAPVRTELAKARADLANAVLQGKPADEIAGFTKAYTTAEANMTSMEVKAFQKVYATLKPNQTSHAPEAFDLMAGILDPSAGGRGRGGMGGGRGRGGR